MRLYPEVEGHMHLYLEVEAVAERIEVAAKVDRIRLYSEVAKKVG
jgi:hypothetical protein